MNITESTIYVLERKEKNNFHISKIGSTSVSVEGRASNYTDGEWSHYFSMKVPSALRYAIEKKAHEILIKDGLWLDPSISDSPSREIFVCDPALARDAVELSLFEIISEISEWLHLRGKKPLNKQLYRMQGEINRLKGFSG